MFQLKVSQAVRDKYHMISPLTETHSTEEKSKQNTTRDIEVKNNLIIARGEGEGCLLYTSDAADDTCVV